MRSRPAPAPAQPDRPDSPYVGLTPFTEDDAPFFFGRESERQIIAANLMASRLSLVYGPSGVGKSSLLRAGVVHDLRDAAKDAVAERKIPESIPIVFSSWSDEPVAALSKLVETTVQELLADLAPKPTDGRLPFADLLAQWTDRLDEHAAKLAKDSPIRQPDHVELLFVLDQFEDYFLYHPGDSGTGTFAAEFPRAVNRAGLRANFLVSLREDAYTLLDVFEDDVPNIFGNNIRIDHLTPEDAATAITGPVHRYVQLYSAEDELLPNDVEKDLVSAVVGQVKTGAITLGEVEAKLVQSQETPIESRIEAPYLQLVMTRIWDEERSQGSKTLRRSTLDELGGAKEIIKAHFDTTIGTLPRSDRTIALRALKYLAPPVETKIALPATTLADWAKPNILARWWSKGAAGARWAKLHHVARWTGLSGLASFLAQFERAMVSRQPEALAKSRVELRKKSRAVKRKVLADRWARLSERGWFKPLAWKYAYEARVEDVLLKLTAGDRRILRVVPSPQRDAPARYEIFHDQLAPGVLDLVTRKTRRRHLIYGTFVILVLAVSISVAVIWLAEGNASKAKKLSVLNTFLKSPHFKAILQGHGGPVVSVSFSPNQDEILTASDDGTARLWNAASGKQLAGVLQPDGAVTSASFSPNGRLVLTTGSEVAVWQTGSRRLLFASSSADTKAGFFSADGLRFAVVGTPLAVGFVRRLDYEALAASATAAAFSPRSVKLLGGGNLGQLSLWNVAAPGPSHPKRFLPAAPITALAYSHNGQRILVARSDGTAQIATIQGHVEHVLRTGLSDASTALISPNNRIALIAGNGAVAQLWSVRTGRRLGDLKCFQGPVAAAFSPDGRLVATGGGDGVGRIWDLSSYGQIASLVGHSGVIRSVQFSPDGSLVITGSDDGIAAVWTVPSEVDLAIARPQVFLTQASAGRRVVELVAEVRNVGLGPAPATTMEAKLTSRGKPLDNEVVPVPALAPGKTDFVSLTLSIPSQVPAGPATLNLRLDPERLLSETRGNTRNDSQTLSFRMPEPNGSSTTVTVASPTTTSTATATVTLTTTSTVNVGTVTVTTPPVTVTEPPVSGGPATPPPSTRG